MDAESAFPLLHHEKNWNLRGTFACSLAGLTATLLVLMGLFTEFVPDAKDRHVDQYYAFFTDVCVMVFLGFGALMTFLKRYSYSAISLNFLCSCLVILEAVLAIGWLQQGWGTVTIDLPLLIDAAFCAGAGMITFGAMLGKVTPAQLIWLLALEVPLYAANAHLAAEWAVLDVGGSITIHTFGALFGLAASFWFSPAAAGSSHPKNGASYSSDMTAMLGTLFLFIYWPSFNGALASAPGETVQPQVYCILNSVVALLGACLAAFAASTAIEGKLDMVIVQNATLAGGVAIGSSANLRIAPAAALAVGIAAGVLSTLGYLAASPLLERRCGITDTCGVFNLHGCPGILGGLASALFAAIYHSSNKPVITQGHKQPLYQLLGLGFTVVVAVAGGFAAGFVVSRIDLAKQTLAVDDYFDDAMYWKEVEHED